MSNDNTDQLCMKLKLIGQYVEDQVQEHDDGGIASDPNSKIQIASKVQRKPSSALRSARKNLNYNSFVQSPVNLYQKKFGDEISKLTQDLKEVRNKNKKAKENNQWNSNILAFDKQTSREYMQQCMPNKKTHENNFSINMIQQYNKLHNCRSSMNFEKQLNRNFSMLQSNTGNDNKIIPVNDRVPLSYQVGLQNMLTFPLTPKLEQGLLRKSKTPKMQHGVPRFNPVVCKHYQQQKQQNEQDEMIKLFLNPQGEPIGQIQQFNKLGHVQKTDTTLAFNKQLSRVASYAEGTVFTNLPSHVHFSTSRSSSNIRNLKCLKDMQYDKSNLPQSSIGMKRYSVSQLSKVRQQLKQKNLNRNPTQLQKQFSYEQAEQALDFKRAKKEETTFIRQVINEGFIDIQCLINKQQKKPWNVKSTKKRHNDSDSSDF